MRVIFAGTPEFSAFILQQLLDNKVDVVAVLTQPDKPKGRGLKLAASDVKLVAQKHNIAVLQPSSLKQDEVIAQLQIYQADLMIVVAYGLIIPTSILYLPRYGCINIHASLLPRWRGAAPIHRAIEAGDKETGISIMQMDVGLDTGPVGLVENIEITDTETTQSLQDKLKKIGAKLCLQALKKIPNLKFTAQSEIGATYAHKIHKNEALLNWNESATVLDRKIRAFNSFPVAKTIINQQEIKIWRSRVLPVKSTHLAGTILAISDQGMEVATSDGVLLIEQVQKPGAQKMSVKEFVQGFTINVGSILG